MRKSGYSEKLFIVPRSPLIQNQLRVGIEKKNCKYWNLKFHVFISSPNNTAKIWACKFSLYHEHFLGWDFCLWGFFRSGQNCFWTFLSWAFYIFLGKSVCGYFVVGVMTHNLTPHIGLQAWIRPRSAKVKDITAPFFEGTVPVPSFARRGRCHRNFSVEIFLTLM